MLRMLVSTQEQKVCLRLQPVDSQPAESQFRIQNGEFCADEFGKIGKIVAVGGHGCFAGVPGTIEDIGFIDLYLFAQARILRPVPAQRTFEFQGLCVPRQSLRFAQPLCRAQGIILVLFRKEGERDGDPDGSEVRPRVPDAVLGIETDTRLVLFRSNVDVPALRCDAGIKSPERGMAGKAFPNEIFTGDRGENGGA